MKPYLTGFQEREIKKQSSRLRKRKSLKCFFERVATQKCGASRNCVQRKISIEKRANRQASETARKEKNKYFSEGSAILAFPAFAEQRALQSKSAGNIKIIRWVSCMFYGSGVKINLNREGENAQQIAPAGQSKASWVLQKAQNPRPFCLPAELCR